MELLEEQQQQWCPREIPEKGFQKAIPEKNIPDEILEGIYEGDSEKTPKKIIAKALKNV